MDNFILLLVKSENIADTMFMKEGWRLLAIRKIVLVVLFLLLMPLALLMLPGSAPALSKTFDSVEYKDFILILDHEHQVNHTFTRKIG